VELNQVDELIGEAGARDVVTSEFEITLDDEDVVDKDAVVARDPRPDIM
jgi:hypothetical protein